MKSILKRFYIKFISMLLICCLGVIVYSNTLYCSFHFDDALSITNNSAIKNIHNLQNIWNFLPRHFILELSFALNYYFDKLNVVGYHLFNLAVHLGSAILVWWFTILTLSTPAMKENKIAQYADFIALFAGLIFVSHPIQTEAVTYIVQRAAAMSTLFYLASLSLYVKSRLMENKESATGVGRFYYICSILLAITAMFTKETAITLPLMIVLYEVIFFEVKKDSKVDRLFPFLLTLFIIPVTMLLTETSAARLQQLRSEPGISSAHYFLTQFRVMLTYIRLLFFPLNQNLDYDYPVFDNFFQWPVLISFLFLMGLFYQGIRLFQKYRLVSFSIFWFFLTLFPESSFLPIKDVIFEHRLYLPMVGYSIFLVSSMYYLFGKNNLKVMCIVLTMVIVCYGVLTYQRNKVWKDDITLWDDAVQKSPHKARPYNYRGVIYSKKKDFVRAISDFTKAIEIDPRLAENYNDRADIYVQQGKFSQAISDYNNAIEIEPALAVLYYNRAILYQKQGEFSQAINDFLKVIALKPKFMPAYGNLGIIYANHGMIIQAIFIFTKAIETDPHYVSAFYNRAMLYYQLKEYDKSWSDVHKTEELGGALNPDFIKLLKKVSGRDK